jgi:hypothetical protein
MEAADAWKAAMNPRLSTRLGKRRQTTAGVSHISHSPCQRPTEKSNRLSEADQPHRLIPTSTRPDTSLA